MQKAALKTYSNLELALMVMLGYYGNGETRKKNLGDRYNTVQGIVQNIIDKQKIPAGTGLWNKDNIKKAVQSAFISDINEISEEIINAIGK